MKNSVMIYSITWETREPKAAALHLGGTTGMFICTLIGLCHTIFNGKR